MVLLITLPNLSYVHCFLPPRKRLLLITPLKYSRFLCCSTPSFGESTKSATKSSLSDCNGNRTHNHLVRKRTLNHLAKLAK